MDLKLHIRANDPINLRVLAKTFRAQSASLPDDECKAAIKCAEDLERIADSLQTTMVIGKMMASAQQTTLEPTASESPVWSPPTQ